MIKNIFICILISIFVFNCKKEKQYVDFDYPRYYLNKDSIEIIEVDKSKIFRYVLRDSIKSELTEKNISYFPNTFDSLKINNFRLVYKRIELNTADDINFENDSFWTGHFNNNFQYWIHFFEAQRNDDYGNKISYDAYTGYSHQSESLDTILYSGRRHYYNFKLFDKFRFAEIGASMPTLCLTSKWNADSISITPVKSYSGNKNIKTYFLEKYNSSKNIFHIGNWEFMEGNICDEKDGFIGTHLKINKENLIFSLKSDSLSKFNYNLGLDSKFLEITESNYYKEYDFMHISTIRIVDVDKNTLKLEISYMGGLCKESDTLLYRK